MQISTQAGSRRKFMRTSLSLVALSTLGYSHVATAAIQAETVTVWKTPSCGCCKDWVIHMRKEGFNVVTNDVPDTAPMRQ